MQMPPTAPSTSNVLLTNLATRLSKARNAPPFGDETIPALLADAYSLTFHLLQLHRESTAQRILLSNVARREVRICDDRSGVSLIDLKRYEGMEDIHELQGLLDETYRRIDAVMPLEEGPVAQWERIEASMP